MSQATVRPGPRATSPTVSPTQPALPPPLEGYLSLLNLWVEVTTGDPVALETCAEQLHGSGTRVTRASDRLEGQTGTVLAGWTTGPAREAFSVTEREVRQRVDGLGGALVTAGALLRDTATALRSARRATAAVRDWFVREAESLLTQVPALSPGYPVAAVQVLERRGTELGESAITRVLAIDDALDRQLEVLTDRLEDATPTHWYEPHRSLARLFGADRQTYPWEPGFDFTARQWGFVGTGMLTTPFVTGAIDWSARTRSFGAAFRRGLWRIPGSALNDLAYNGVLSSSVTGVRYMSDPLLDHLAGDAASGGMAAAMDQSARRLAETIQARTGAALPLKLNSGLGAWTMGVLPLTVDAANWLVDRSLDPPAVTDPDNLRYHANVWSHALATAAAVAGPVYVDLAFAGEAALAPSAIVGAAITTQGVVSQYGFGPPPPHPDPVYDALHAVAAHPITQLAMEGGAYLGNAVELGYTDTIETLRTAGSTEPTGHGHFAGTAFGPVWVSAEQEALEQARRARVASSEWETHGRMQLHEQLFDRWYSALRATP